jgi:hypothetical protein
VAAIGLGAVASAERICGEDADRLDPTGMSLASAIFATFSHRTKNTTTRSERTYRCRRTRRFGVMCAEQGACVRRRSWAGYTIVMFELEFPTGTAAPIAQDLSYRLLQLGLVANAVVDSHVQSVSAGMTGPTVTTITVSHSGSTVETVLATRAREAGARTIGITRLGKSPLAAHCEVMLHTVANETRYRPEAMSSRVAQLATIDTLVSCCALTDTERSIERLNHATRILSEKRF